MLAYHKALKSLIYQVIIFNRLESRLQMKFGLSEGMVTAAGPGATEVFLLSVDSGAQNGDRIH